MLRSSCKGRFGHVRLCNSSQRAASRRSYALKFDPATVSPTLVEKLKELQDRELPDLVDTISSDSSELLSTTLADFLPFTETPIKRKPGQLIFGHHLAYFRPPIATRALLPDGTDLIHSPGEPWTQRLWAGGSLRIQKSTGLSTRGSKHVLSERITDVRVSGTNESERIFVTIGRSIKTLAAFEKESLAQARAPAALGGTMRAEHPVLVEERVLCFMREPPGRSLAKPRSPIHPPTAPDFSHTLTPTPALLFRFSALTFNAHAIHIDPDYTRDVYGLPGLLVHGPLTLILMVEFMRRALHYHDLNDDGPVSAIVEIEYKNLMPLFVNEEMTICCKKHPHQARSGHSSWTVWVQKAYGDQTAMAVKASVKCEPESARLTPTEGVKVRHASSRKDYKDSTPTIIESEAL